MKIVECKFDRQDGKCVCYSCFTDAGTVISAHIHAVWRRFLGDEYICAHLVLVPKKVGEEWELKVLWADYHNDVKQNPPRTRKLRWAGFDFARGYDIYEDTREPGQCCCRWEENGIRWDDFDDESDIIRPNVTLICPEKGICEKIRYDDDLGLIAVPVEEVKNNA